MSTSRPVSRRSAFGRMAAGISTIVSLPVAVLAVQAPSAAASVPSPPDTAASGVGPLAGVAQSELLGLPLGAAIWLLVGLMAVIVGLWFATRRPVKSPDVETITESHSVRTFSLPHIQARVRSAAGTAPRSAGAAVNMDE